MFVDKKDDVGLKNRNEKEKEELTGDELLSATCLHSHSSLVEETNCLYFSTKLSLEHYINKYHKKQSKYITNQ